MIRLTVYRVPGIEIFQELGEETVSFLNGTKRKLEIQFWENKGKTKFRVPDNPKEITTFFVEIGQTTKVRIPLNREIHGFVAPISTVLTEALVKLAQEDGVEDENVLKELRNYEFPKTAYPFSFKRTQVE